ncbi:aspartyl protease family protein [Pelagicoccus sp. SDUM812003]|uniref:retropepsin-like aspartic protease n=1 Tax=Pelagicoccus sp. SDUM812003 TaxID=3041267 RepID=UPI00280DCDE1|nr:aspartyl protease family protein [Pelagicoccus sp. SDUM812003]MDQ8205118.1 aspartyl protease family protein [Pelagicoccus sp. SDUM812003]
MKTLTLTLISLMALAYPVKAKETMMPEWMTEGPVLSDGAASIEAPLEVVASKLYVEVEVGGKPRRFVVDTGSPSMIDAALVRELGLEVVGSSQGRDAHGALITSDIVQTTVSLGGVAFHKVPMFVADFSASEATRTFIGDGVLGSELLPLGAWQFDLKSARLRFDTDATNLPRTARAVRTRLYGFGYPHAPILDVRFAKKARSKAMFDTGSPTFFALSPADLAGASEAGGIGKRQSGYGSPGGSLGGQAPDSEQLQVELKSLSIGKIELGRVASATRESSPSLIGARILERFVVTFDSQSETAYFDRYSEDSYDRPSFGFTLAFFDGISVAVVWDDSPAQAAGLRPGMPLTSINGEATELTSEGILRALAAMEGQEISLSWEGGSAKLTSKSRFLHE